MPRQRPKRRLPWAAYLWPGLPHLWVRGSWAGLTLALAFTVLLNVVVLATLVWPSWLETRLKFGCAAALGLLWLAALWETHGELKRQAAERDQTDKDQPPETNHPNDKLLRSAQRSYLQGDWATTERTLRQALRADRHDAEAALWLVTLLRHTGRLKQASRRLKRLERLDDAQPWSHEIAQEWRLIDPPEAPTDPQEPTLTLHQPTDETFNDDAPGAAPNAQATPRAA